MKNQFITPLDQALEPFWEARFEQVQLQVERNPEDYPRCREDYVRYHNAIDRIKENNPGVSHDVEQLVSAMHLYYSDLAMEAYRQGGKDWMQMFHAVCCVRSSCPMLKEGI